MNARTIGAALLLAGGTLPAQAPARYDITPAASATPVMALLVEPRPSFNPDDGTSGITDWRARADSLRDAGRHREAIAAYERAMQLGVMPPARAALDVARAYAQLDNRRQALRWLAYARALGLADRDLLRSAPEFERYRGDARFRAIAEPAVKLPSWRAV